MLQKKIQFKKFVFVGLVIAIVFGVALVGLSQVKVAPKSSISCFCPYTKSTQYGGGGGGVFSDDLTQVKKITQIIVRSGTYVDAINVSYLLTSGETITINHGGTGGTPSTIPLKDGEYITRIDGRAGSYIDQITFYTNLGSKFGPYGGSGGSEFSISNLYVGGFFGRCAAYVDAIGVFTAVK